MQRVKKVRRRIPEIIMAWVLLIMYFRRWTPEVAIVVAMLIALLVELGLRLTPGRHTVAHVVAWGLLFGLIALWVYINRAALEAWEHDNTQEWVPPNE